MTIFQLLMLGASGYFAFKIYEHIQTLQEEEHVEVHEDVKSADAFSPFSADELLQKADSAFDEKDFHKALAFLSEADKKDADNSEILFKTAFILEQINNSDEALNYYKKALEVDEDNEFIHNAMASIYRKNSEFTSAKMHLHASLELDEQNPVTYYNYGNLLVDMKHNEEAKEMYKKALELKPDFTQAQEEMEKL